LLLCVNNLTFSTEITSTQRLIADEPRHVSNVL
jgi:hypothetical protein